MELKALMVASLGGDAGAYRSLLDRLSSRLRAYYKGKLARVGRGATEAEDLVQEVLLAIHLKRHTYDTGEPFTPWVHTIARYKLIDYLRRTRTAAGKNAVLHRVREARGAECSGGGGAVRYLGIGCQDQHSPRLAHVGDLYRAGDQ